MQPLMSWASLSVPPSQFLAVLGTFYSLFLQEEMPGRAVTCFCEGRGLPLEGERLGPESQQGVFCLVPGKARGVSDS